MHIDKLLDIQHNQLKSRVKRLTHERSSWTTNWTIKKPQLVISEITPCEEWFLFSIT